MQGAEKVKIVSSLQSEILQMQGFKPANSAAVDLGLYNLRDAFPNASFPLGCVHEFLSATPADAAATNGFVSGLLASLLGDWGILLWISSSRSVFPPSLKRFGIQPDRIIFIDVQHEKDVLWAMEEALKCNALTAVVGELAEISFTESRRLQLATERSQVTGFILRTRLTKISTTACVSRWKISALPSLQIDDLPGIGFPRWKVELLRIRNGRTGAWDIQWIDGKFNFGFERTSLKVVRDETQAISSLNQKKAG